MDLPNVLVDAIIDRALAEDLSAGDITSEACIDASTTAIGHAVARAAMVACGGDVFARVFKKVDESLDATLHVEDGTPVAAGTRLWTVRGRARSVLAGERVALNLAQRMTGISTMTARYVAAITVGAKTRITDTRKTTPGLRVLERYAVRKGGGYNHRDHLGSAVLIKDNHIVACGGAGAAVSRAKARATHTCRIECEIDRVDQLEEVIAAGADIVLLDNMSTDIVREAVRIAAGRVLLEASGGITLERVAELSLAGVNAISVGALTHSAHAADIGLDFASSNS
jgi:nicotinate-nucleotide pyrophosphorylase (carboxylating)